MQAEQGMSPLLKWSSSLIQQDLNTCVLGVLHANQHWLPLTAFVNNRKNLKDNYKFLGHSCSLSRKSADLSGVLSNRVTPILTLNLTKLVYSE